MSFACYTAFICVVYWWFDKLDCISYTSATCFIVGFQSVCLNEHLRCMNHNYLLCKGRHITSWGLNDVVWTSWDLNDSVWTSWGLNDVVWTSWGLNGVVWTSWGLNDVVWTSWDLNGVVWTLKRRRVPTGK